MGGAWRIGLVFATLLLGATVRFMLLVILAKLSLGLRVTRVFCEGANYSRCL